MTVTGKAQKFKIRDLSIEHFKPPLKAPSDPVPRGAGPPPSASWERAQNERRVPMECPPSTKSGEVPEGLESSTKAEGATTRYPADPVPGTLVSAARLRSRAWNVQREHDLAGLPLEVLPGFPGLPKPQAAA